ncbi:zymogen granule membrane protein 16-like [Microcaecilia unicolor]|uniref:Zymogen granule membrane protein 16-like n=1 Tax=Microcaecilia unicolor TaxID=1415580 RepID=A0A6P7YTR2_9AMPH|nr:zymogen granule membrane protein 16-like [Microcaecilia unicolor]
MLRVFFFSLLCVGSCLSAASPRTSSYSGEYGGKGGKKFSQSKNQLDGPITAIRIRLTTYYIVGLQVRYGTTWSTPVGSQGGHLEEVFLEPGESVVQVAGKYTSYVRKLVFVTDQRRYYAFGNDYGISFNATPLYPGTVLRFFSGRASTMIDAIGFHWGTYISVTRGTDLFNCIYYSSQTKMVNKRMHVA